MPLRLFFDFIIPPQFSNSSHRVCESGHQTKREHKIFSSFFYVPDSDWPWPLLGAQVNVCDSEDDSSCKLCGYVTERWAASWITVFCPNGGLNGSRVSVQKTYGNILIICEIELYGVLVSNH